MLLGRIDVSHHFPITGTSAPDSAKRERKILAWSGTVKRVITIGVEDPEKAIAEDAHFTSAVAAPVAHYGNIARYPAKRERLIAARAIDIVEDPVAVGVQNPVKAQPE